MSQTTRFDLNLLDFIVINKGTGNPVAAFMLYRDARAFAASHGADKYDVVNADGTPLNSWNTK
jgi:hypothetical protein